MRAKKLLPMVLALAVMISMLIPCQAFAASSYVKSLSVSKTTVSVKAGSSTSVTATVKVAKSAKKSVTVKSSNTAIATVTKGSVKSGKTKITIKGKKKGTATITVTTDGKNKSKKKITKKITVKVDYANVTGLTVSPSSKTLDIGGTATISKTVAPSTANPAVTYSSSNTSVATVSSAGKITAVAPGKATITVKTAGKNSSGASLTKKVSVTVNYAPVTALTVNPGNADMVVGDKITFSKRISPSTANQNVTCESSDTSVATVSGNTITAVGEGDAVITVTAAGRDANGDYVQREIYVNVLPMYTYEMGTKQIQVKFKLPEGANKAEFEAQGYTVVNGEASRLNTCNTIKYTFNKLPSTPEEIKMIKLNGPDTEFASTAALICALHTFDKTKGDRTNNAPMTESIGYLLGPNQADFITGNYGGVNRSFISGQLMDHPEIMNMYFDGASPSNGYKVEKPYTITLYEGPYYISAKDTINGSRPQTDMIFVYGGSNRGFDTDRYVDVFKSSDGNTYIWGTSYRNFLASGKSPSTVW